MSKDDHREPADPRLDRIFREAGAQLPAAEITRRLGAIQFNPLKRPDLHNAAMEGDIPAMKEAIAGGADVNEADPIFGTALHSAAESGQDKAIDFLIEQGADINSPTLLKKHTPLDNALRFGRRETAFKLALKGGTATMPHTKNKIFHRQATADYAAEYTRLQERLAKHRMEKLVRVKRTRNPR